ncbi:uncharacterized protein PFL1_03643 [Pseudozyma flocculosa PF-1]|nr:uncharacterized protein PFL1_03643 [Pseudozyma flocculosa PF-1]EPQ28840.1 hypothetical protein PFL1_03643 [Pseudozyma flocculosa PF-1]
MKPSSYKWAYLAAGIALRVGLLAFGRYQDAHSAVPYTDVDYSVFSDASKAILDGCSLSHTIDGTAAASEADIFDDAELRCARGILPAMARFLLLNDPQRQTSEQHSAFQQNSFMFAWATRCYDLARPLFRAVASLGDPYSRPTYRYTPLLALALTPIHLFGWADFGKYLFASADVLCALLMWLILDGRRAQGSPAGIHVHLPGLIWLLNPLPAQISTRGSSEALVGLSVLSFVYFLLSANPEAPLGLTPVHETADAGLAPPSKALDQQATEAVPTYRPLVPESALPLSEWSAAAYLSPAILGLAVHLKIFPVIYGIPVMAHLSQSTEAAFDPVARRKLGLLQRHSAGIQYGLIAFATFMATNAVAWLFWGAPFVEHTFAYHLTRQDHRHNFSPYFLTTYLSNIPGLRSSTATAAIDSLESRLLSSPLFSFAPQALLVAVLGWRLGKRDVVAAMTAQTIAFVAFNKVCTSQYFLWFLWLVPIVWPSLSIRPGTAAVAVGSWIGAQALWLSQAYLLEFKAQDVFVRIWVSSLALLAVHAALLVTFVRAWARYRISFKLPPVRPATPSTTATTIPGKAA